MNKFDKAQKVLQELKADGWLIACNEDSDIHSRFLLGVGSHARHYIYVAADGQHQILAVEMEASMIKKSLEKKGIDANIIKYEYSKEIMPKLTPIINKERIALNIGEKILNEESTEFADHIKAGDYLCLKELAPNTDFFSAAPIIKELREVKTPEELNDLRNVCKITIEILESIPDWIKVGMTELEIKAKIEYEYMKLGKPAFETIVGFGPNSADPHHNTSRKKIETGVLLIDTGLQIDQMCSDITWTFWIGNAPSKEFLKAYKTLYESKEIANTYLTDETPCYLSAKNCREYLAQKGYDHEKLFFHGFGHSLGFVAHDIGTRISWKTPEKHRLKENMVYTNEPGLYWRNKWGIRLEDDIIIKKNQCEKATYVPKEPILI